MRVLVKPEIRVMSLRVGRSSLCWTNLRVVKCESEQRSCCVSTSRRQDRSFFFHHLKPMETKAWIELKCGCNNRNLSSPYNFKHKKKKHAVFLRSECKPHCCDFLYFFKLLNRFWLRRMNDRKVLFPLALAGNHVARRN